MWCYVKTLQYPVNLKCSDLNMAKLLITQFGGPDGELSAALRYLSQRFSMPTNKSKGMLNDIGTEEMAHVEIISTKEIEPVLRFAHSLNFEQQVTVNRCSAKDQPSS